MRVVGWSAAEKTLSIKLRERVDQFGQGFGAS
jgi:hypothetical protein